MPNLDLNRKPQAVLPRHLEEKLNSAGRGRFDFVFLLFQKNRRFLWKIFIVVLAAAAVFIISKQFTGQPAEESVFNDKNWYSVKLVNGEVYFGQIENISADPLVLKNVYYDYDQAKTEEKKEAGSSASLRLVKRGNETYGPSGEMNIVRSQALFMEPLKADSKVLKAIKEYETNK